MPSKFESHITDDFRRRYDELPAEIRRLAREAYLRFRADPWHPGLRFKPMKGSRTNDTWSARINGDYRVLGVLVEPTTIVWYWIGCHADYDEQLNRRR